MNTKYVVGIVAVVGLIGVGVLFSITQSERGDTALTEGVRADGTFSIVTSFYPLQYALEEIVGDLATVENVGEGRDPHDFQPSAQNVLTLQRADLVVLQGAQFEPWGDDMKARLEADGVPVVLATDKITLHEGGHDHADEHYDEKSKDEHEEEHAHEDEGAHEEGAHEEEHAHEAEAGHDDHDHGAYDPHTWLDPVLFSEMVEHLTAEISALDPENVETYQANAARLQSELAILNEEYVSRLATCSLDEVITSHDSFGYVADRYNFKAHSIAGLSTQDQPSVATLAALRAEAEEGIGAILLEQSSITAYGETLSRETGLQTLSINTIAYVIPTGETYLTLMRSNLATLATALACNE